MSVTYGDEGLGSVTVFNDTPVYSCWIDGEVFRDAHVYAQHMLMTHGLVITVSAPSGEVIVPAPVNPIVPPPNPSMVVAPGVTFTPVGGNNFTPAYTPPLFVPAAGGASQATTSPSNGGSPTAWAWLGIIGAILAFGAIKRRKRK